MKNNSKHWEILSKSKSKEIIEILLENRGIKSEKDKKEFFNPTDPQKIGLKELGISNEAVKKAIKRIKQAKEKGEHVIIYGDYDADGICATAILWETLHSLGLNVLPYIPERFSEGYGLNTDSIRKLKEKDKDLGLIITVDHGIVADKKIDFAQELGIGVIITDHHQPGKITPKALSVIHTTKISGSGISWIFAREIVKSIQILASRFEIRERLQLAAIGTIADQLPITGPNRSIVKFGLEELNRTRRPGLLALFEEAKIGPAAQSAGAVGTYEVGFIIAPRINSMGRLKHGLESLRLLCTTKSDNAKKISQEIGLTNTRRQEIVDRVVEHAILQTETMQDRFVIVLSSDKYHEGVIGLAAARLVEKFYRPAIVFSQGKKISKASARSIPGFDIIQNIRELSDLYLEGGGHPMAAGFSIETVRIEEFSHKINELAKTKLTPEILTKRLRIDAEIPLTLITNSLADEIKRFEPTGPGNYEPLFMASNLTISSVKKVGRDFSHLKLDLVQKEAKFGAIFFNGGKIYPDVKIGDKIDAVFSFEENEWNGRVSLQLKLRDLRFRD